MADDALLERLSGHPTLRIIYLWGTSVTKQGVARYRKANPKVIVVEDELTRVSVSPDYSFDIQDGANTEGGKGVRPEWHQIKLQVIVPKALAAGGRGVFS
jgi:hypothetical protein